ncbi:MAG: hypothetical protein HYY06_00895 [Deltaproteobacteria bacterium]|nr:hypothetical protein [Deltaproteobacteria bacterium]
MKRLRLRVFLSTRQVRPEVEQEGWKEGRADRGSCSLSSRLPVDFGERSTRRHVPCPRLRASVALLLVCCACAQRETGDPRADRAALARVLAVDDAAAMAMEPALDAIETGHAGEALALLEGQVRQLARRAVRRARAAQVQTRSGRALKADLVEAVTERERVVELAAAAARSGRAEDLLEAVRAARALEESVADLDLKIEALAAPR